MATTDLASTCFTCAPLERYVALTTDFASELSNALGTPMLILFTSLIGVWAVINGAKLALKQCEIHDLGRDLIYIIVTGAILGSQQNGLISWVYSTALTVMAGSSEAAFAVAGGSLDSSGYSGLVALAANGEAAFAKIIQASSAIARAGALYNLSNYIYAFLLILPYFLLVVMYSSQVVVAIFRAMMVAIFAPFLFMAFAFGWGRQMSYAGVKTLLASVLVLFACTSALALTIYGVKQIPIDPSSLTGDALNNFVSASNPDFLVILFLGWMGSALMTEGTSIANSIAQTALTNTAAGMLTAGTAATAGGMMAAGKKLGSFTNPLTAGRRFTEAARSTAEEIGGWKAMGQTAKSLVDKFKNINKPDGGPS
jgi:hypothetical protein